MLEAKDTIINREEFEALIQHIIGKEIPKTETELGNLIADACRPPVEAQAAISFRMGKQEGIKKVVEWIEKRDCAYHLFGDFIHHFKIMDNEWQAKLKEWGIEPK